MDFRRNSLLLVACATLLLSITQGVSTGDLKVMKTIVLDEVTPQGLLQLPPTHYKMEAGYLCHYWASFLKDIPEDVLEHHKENGISVMALNLNLKSEASIMIMGHPVDGNSSNSDFEKVIWDSSSNSDSPSLEFKPKFQDICIKMNGDWTLSTAKLVVTLFYDNTNTNYENCPSGMSKCECTTDSTRCISQDLFCNGISNCGVDCKFDESDSASCGTLDNSHVMKEVILSEVTPQGHLHLPPSHYNMNDRLCHYWISFLKDIPESALPYHKNFGISIVPLKMELKPEDSIVILGHPVDGNKSTSGFEKITWDSSLNSALNLEFRPMFQDVCINLKGDWTRSKVELIVTLFFNNSEMYEDYCPEGMTRCKCSAPNNRRCISEDLICNGVSNCGVDCHFDESESASCDKKTSTHYEKEVCLWSSFQYVIMMMSGLMLILIPAVVLTMLLFYKRMQRSPRSFDGNNNVNRGNGQHSHVISMAPANDIPPRYDDLPEGVKAPIIENEQHY